MSGLEGGLAEGYERMRAQRRGPGYELLRRRGLAGWMETALAYVRAPLVSAEVSPSLERPGGCVPESLYPALTRLLAGVAMGWLREELS